MLPPHRARARVGWERVSVPDAGRCVMLSPEWPRSPSAETPSPEPQHFAACSINDSGVKMEAIKPLYLISSPEDEHFGTRDRSARTAATCVLPTIRSAGVTSLRRRLYNSNAVL